MPERQAEATARAILGAVEDATGRLATREHLDMALRELRAEVKEYVGRLEAQMASVRVGLKDEMNALRTETQEAFAGFQRHVILAVVGLTVAVVLALPVRLRPLPQPSRRPRATPTKLAMP